MNRRQMLVAHYTGLLKKFAAWSGMIALVAAVMVPAGASATGLITSRSAAPSTSAPSATSVNYTFTFKAATTGTVRAVGIQFCTSPGPNYNSSCTVPTGLTAAGATFSSGTSGNTAPFNANFILGTGAGGNCPAPTATAMCIDWATGNSLTSGSSYTFIIGGVTNPSTANYEYYTRITTYSDQAGTTAVDYGGEALSTGTTINVSALVQESLVLAVGSSDTGTCGTISGAQVYLGTTDSNGTATSVLSSSAANVGKNFICINTNANSGYTLSYISSTPGHGVTPGTFTNYTGTAHDFHDYNTSAVGWNTANGTNAGASDFFGISFAAAAGGVNGDTAGGNAVTGASGYVAPTFSSSYGTADVWQFTHNALTQVASETTGATVNTKYTCLYSAQAAAASTPGQYETNMDFVATGTF